jgi:cell division inhibitor SepF
MSIKTKFKTFFYLNDEYDDNEQEYIEEEIESAKPIKQPTAKQNVVSLQSIQKSSKMVLFEPRDYAEAQDITDHLKNRRTVVVNLQRIDREQGKQIVDFLSGAVYALGGHIQKIGANIFLCTPDNVEVSGNISEIMQNHDF